LFRDEDIDELGQFIINELAKELIKQDHNATGKLISSLDFNTSIGAGTFSLLVVGKDYGKWVNTGRKKGAAKVPIQALVEWIKVKGIETNNKKVLGMAFAIQKTIQKEGIPTRNSRKRGKRTGFVDDTIIRIQQILDKKVLDMASKVIELEIDNLVKIR
jgi:hypothetical protein